MLTPWWSDRRRALHVLGSGPTSIEAIQFRYRDGLGVDPEEPTHEGLLVLCEVE